MCVWCIWCCYNQTARICHVPIILVILMDSDSICWLSYCALPSRIRVKGRKIPFSIVDHSGIRLKQTKRDPPFIAPSCSVIKYFTVVCLDLTAGYQQSINRLTNLRNNFTTHTSFFKFRWASVFVFFLHPHYLETCFLFYYLRFRIFFLSFFLLFSPLAFLFSLFWFRFLFLFIVCFLSGTIMFCGWSR